MMALPINSTAGIISAWRGSAVEAASVHSKRNHDTGSMLLARKRVVVDASKATGSTLPGR